VHVAGVALVPDGRDADLRLRQVVLGKPHAEEDRLGPALGLGLRHLGAVTVELADLGAGWGCG